MPLRKLQQRLKEMAAMPCWELIKAISKSEEIVVTETWGFLVSLLGFLLLCAVLDGWSIFSSFLPHNVIFLRGGTALNDLSISQLCMQVSSQPIFDAVCLEVTLWYLWAGSGKRRELFSALDPTEGMSWLPGPTPDPSVCGKHNLFMHRRHFLPLISHHRACIWEMIALLGWLKSRGNLRYVIIAQKSTASSILWSK